MRDNHPSAARLDPAALDKLLSLVGGDQAFLVELASTFLDEAPTLMADMRDSLERGDADGMRLAAHSLKSNGNDFGATTFADLCKQLELLGRSGNLASAADLMAQAEQEFARVEVALRALADG
jgi:HPt (histidine-containing phosphotransfer) domain-containing protein